MIPENKTVSFEFELIKSEIIGVEFGSSTIMNMVLIPKANSTIYLAVGTCDECSDNFMKFPGWQKYSIFGGQEC